VSPETFCQFDVHGGAPAQPAVAADRDPGHQPVAGADLFDGEVDDDHVDALQVFEFGIVDPYPGVEHLTEDQDFAGPLREAAQRHVGGGQRDGARLDGRDAQDRDENPSAVEQFDDDTEYSRLLAAIADADHHVTDTADRLTVGAEHQHPRHAGRVDPVDRHHG